MALLDEDQALAMLFSESGQTANGYAEEQCSREIVRALDRLPLAIELAGAYLRHRPACSECHYDRQLCSDRKRQRNLGLDDHSNRIGIIIDNGCESRKQYCVRQCGGCGFG